MDSNLVAGLIGALAAIGGVVVGGLVPWKIQQRAEEESKVRDYRETILRLLDVRERQIEEWAKVDDPNAAYREDALNGRRRMLRSIAESLAEHIPARLSAHDRIQLGYECQIDADYEAAQHQYTHAVARAATEDPGDRVIALRYLAAMYYIQTSPGFNPDLGAQTYAQAVAITSGNADPHGGKFITGYTYYLWAYALAGLGSPEWEEKAELARRFYESIPASYQQRKTGLERLNKWIEQMGTGEQQPPPVSDVR